MLFVKTLFDGSLFLIPLYALSAIALAIILERAYYLILRSPMLNSKTIFQKVRGLVLERKLTDAIAVCESHKSSPTAKVLREGLVRAHQPESFIEHGLELAVGEAIQKIQARTSYLSTIANVSTLAGLCGTVMGLIRSFAATADLDGHQASVAITKGISEAMSSTLLGLSIAIVCVLFYSFFMSRIRALSFQINSAAINTLDLVKESKLKPESSYTRDSVPIAPGAAAARN
jgi:biopolymer transport protein ExbB